MPYGGGCCLSSKRLERLHRGQRAERDGGGRHGGASSASPLPVRRTAAEMGARLAHTRRLGSMLIPLLPSCRSGQACTVTGPRSTATARPPLRLAPERAGRRHGYARHHREAHSSARCAGAPRHAKRWGGSERDGCPAFFAACGSESAEPALPSQPATDTAPGTRGAQFST